MITGLGSAKDLASGKKGAFYNTLKEFSKYWERIDIIAPKSTKHKTQNTNKAQNTEHKTQTIILFGNVYVHISPWPLVFHPFWFLKRGIEIYQEQKFDLMTVQEFPPFYNGIGARIISWLIKTPYVLEIHHIPGYPKAANLKEKIYRNLMRWFINFDASKATAVRVVNKKQTPEFLIKAGVPENKIIYIPSMYIDLEVFKPMDPAKEYDVIFVGRLVENKGINLFLDAIKKLNAKAIIIGDGPLRDWVQSQITNYQLPITNFGWAKDSQEIAALMNKSKILVMPSYNEGGPRVVLEAMACGVPVLATAVGIAPDFSSVVVIDWNSDDIAKKISHVLSNEAEYMRLRKEGLEIAKQFEKKEAIKNYADKLKEILD